MQYRSIRKQDQIAEVYQLVVCNGTLAIESTYWSSQIFPSLSRTVLGGIVLSVIVGRFLSKLYK